MKLNDTLTEFANNLIADIQYEMDNQGLGGSDLSKSLDYTVDGNRVTVTAAHYLPYAEKGRGPGFTPRNFINILETWITKNGIKPTSGTITDFAWAIKKTIEKRGSAIFRGDRPERDVTTVPIEENLDELKKKIGMTVIESYTGVFQ